MSCTQFPTITLGLFVQCVVTFSTNHVCIAQEHDKKDICDKLIEVSKNEYVNKFIKSVQLQATNRFKKTDNELTIQTANKKYTFKDYLERGDSITTYRVAGEVNDKNWVIIERKELHRVLHYLINTKTSKIDSLIGPLKIFGDKIVSLESGYTDSPRWVEIYRIKDDKIVLRKKFSLGKCNSTCCLLEFYLNNNTLYILTDSDKNWKLRIL